MLLLTLLSCYANPRVLCNRTQHARVSCFFNTENCVNRMPLTVRFFASFYNQANLIVLMKIISRLRNSQKMRNYSLKRQVKSGTRATAATMPLLGVTWLFGMLTFHTNLTVFKYLFTICNSLQGVFIFIFHCLLDQKVSYGWASFENL